MVEEKEINEVTVSIFSGAAFINPDTGESLKNLVECLGNSHIIEGAGNVVRFVSMGRRPEAPRQSFDRRSLDVM